MIARAADKPVRGQCHHADCVSFIWTNSSNYCWWHDEEGKEANAQGESKRDRKKARAEGIEERNRIKGRRKRNAKHKALKAKKQKGR